MRTIHSRFYCLQRDVFDGVAIASYCKSCEGHAAVEWFVFFSCIREVPSSNLGLQTGHHDRFYVIFLSPSKQMPRQ
jgi:hypothetical protein